MTSKKNLIKSPVILVAGPTASGKSQLAVELAQLVNGCVINADSMQLFKELPILSAQPPQALQATIPHDLYGLVTGAEPTSVGIWLVHALEAIDAARNRGQIPILVGGTGLYFESLREGLSQVPAVPELVKDELRQELEEKGLPLLYQQLQSQDPRTAKRLQATDTQRILRALAVVRTTGVPLSQWQGNKSAPTEHLRFFALLVDPSRESLKNRIRSRTAQMFESGAIREVQQLLAHNYSALSPVHKAIGVAPIQAYLAGEISREEALEKTIIASQQYAKRQQTWFRHRFKPDAVLADCSGGLPLELRSRLLAWVQKS